MFDIENFKRRIFSADQSSFNHLAIEAFNYQYENNSIYQSYCQLLSKTPSAVNKWQQIPFLPIDFFKSQKVICGHWAEEKVFLSSGTTGQIRSKHYVKDLNFYHQVSQFIFEANFGKLTNFNLYAILPSYQKMGDSSLLSMVDHFITYSGKPSGYFLESQKLPSASKKELIFGVTYALLDGEIIHKDLSQCMIMDTGGMKGRKKEMVRDEVIELLKKKYQQTNIWTEYGMTELTSQAYGKNGMLKFPSWGKVLIRDINDPFLMKDEHQAGGINIIDLANIETCCFIETKDIGKIHGNEHFEVLGRFDNSDIRGCSLLI
ncbi:MAG: acyl transferase [Cyclobacteriaceae bacterium]